MSMSEEQIVNKLRSIFINVFDIKEDEIENESSPNTIKNWDSLGHLQLVLAIEDEFNISITADEAMEMITFDAVKNLLVKHLLTA